MTLNSISSYFQLPQTEVPYPVLCGTGIDARALHMLGNHSTHWAIFPWKDREATEKVQLQESKGTEESKWVKSLTEGLEAWTPIEKLGDCCWMGLFSSKTRKPERNQSFPCRNCEWLRIWESGQGRCLWHEALKTESLHATVPAHFLLPL